MKTGEVDSVLDDLNKIYTIMDKIDPEYVFLRRGKSVTLDRIIEILPPEKDMILIQYFITKDKMFVFVISNDGESLSQNIHVETVSTSEEEIFRQVRSFQNEISSYFYFKNSGGWIDRTQDIIKLLSDILIKPISKYITTGKKICFVPYGHLHYIPLHAFEANGEPLIKGHLCFYLPSTSVFSFCKNKGNGKFDTCAAFGVIFKEEAKQVAKLFNTNAHLDATQNTVLDNLSNDILHFACHGKFDSADPLSSSIILHNDVLTARSIFDLSISSELVTLSACDTGINENLQGDELIGLTRSILYAGSPSVIVSLWPVYDPSTTQLMIAFYEHIQEAKDKASALQIAQKNIMEKGEYSHPYYWAPFILIGDWE